MIDREWEEKRYDRLMREMHERQDRLDVAAGIAPPSKPEGIKEAWEALADIVADSTQGQSIQDAARQAMLAVLDEAHEKPAQIDSIYIVRKDKDALRKQIEELP